MPIDQLQPRLDLMSLTLTILLATFILRGVEIDSSGVWMNQSLIGEQDAVFIISVAARLVEMQPSTLRKYERCGLLEPGRLSGRLRLYSEDDIARLRQLKGLVDERGINLAGV